MDNNENNMDNENLVEENASAKETNGEIGRASCKERV